MKKIISCVLVICMIMSLFTLPVFAKIVDSGTCGDNLTWTLDSKGTLTISGTGDMVNYKPFETPWYSMRRSISNAIIENGVTSIGNYAFYYCGSLTSITIPNGVTRIGELVFEACTSLTSIIIPDSVTTIEDLAFWDCNRLISITIPNSLTSIGKNAFWGCTSLTNVYYDGSEEDWNNININDGNEHLSYAIIYFSIEPTPTAEPTEEPTPSNIVDSGTCGDNLTWTLDSEGTLTISGTGEMKNYNVSNDSPWYSSRSSIKNVVIEKGVTSIGYSAFEYCTSLTDITIPDSVTSIGSFAFKDCSSLTSITIFDGITSIGVGAFESCESLTSITIPDSVTSIGDGAFINCWNLTSITIPDSVTGIGRMAFCGCSNLTSITIPDSVTTIGENTFYYCTRLTGVYYGGSEENWNNISIGDNNGELTNATIHYNSIFANKLTNIHNNNGETVTLPEGAVLNTGENLNFRNGYVNAENGYVKAGDKKITGNNIYFTDEGKIRMEDGYTAKVERDNGNGTTDQGFVFGILNPTGNIRMILEVTGETSGTDYTGRTITKDFDFSDSQLFGLVNIGFTVNKIPKPLSLEIKSVE